MISSTKRRPRPAHFTSPKILLQRKDEARDNAVSTGAGGAAASISALGPHQEGHSTQRPYTNRARQAALLQNGLLTPAWWPGRRRWAISVPQTGVRALANPGTGARGSVARTCELAHAAAVGAGALSLTWPAIYNRYPL